MATPCRGDCKARQMIQLGAVIGCGSTAWPSGHRTGGSPSIPQSAFADSSLCTREPSLPRSTQPAKAKKSPPCAKGGQHGAAMQGGLCNPGSVQIKRLPVGSLFIRHCSALCLGLHLVSCRCWLASTGAQEQTTHTAFSEFWPSGHRTSVTLLAGRGSAIWVQRHAAAARKRR